MNISAVIPTKNRLDDLLKTIRSVTEQSLLPAEIIVVDQSLSTDIMDEAVKLFNGLKEKMKDDVVLKYIHDPDITGLTQARNRAIDANGCDIVLFLDDDVILEKDFIFNIMEIFRRHDDVYGVSGVVTNTQKGFIGDLIYKVFMKGPFTDKRYLINTGPKYRKEELIDVSILPGGLTAYRREVFNDFMFDENFIKYGLSEDFDFSYRVSRKYRNAITPRARLLHVASSVGRSDQSRIRESLVLSMHYFFTKNLEKSFYNYLCFFWYLFGGIIYGLLLFILNGNNDTLTGYMKGIKKMIRDQGSHFLRASDKMR